MTSEMVVPACMHEQVTAGQYATWTDEQVTAGQCATWADEQVTAGQYATWIGEQCAGIEIVDGMVCVGPRLSKQHNRLARLLANALDDAAGPDWNADTDFDVRLQDVPLNNRRPDLTVYRAETIDITPARPEHVLLVVEVVSPGS